MKVYVSRPRSFFRVHFSLAVCFPFFSLVPRQLISSNLEATAPINFPRSGQVRLISIWIANSWAIGKDFSQNPMQIAKEKGGIFASPRFINFYSLRFVGNTEKVGNTSLTWNRKRKGRSFKRKSRFTRPGVSASTLGGLPGRVVAEKLPGRSLIVSLNYSFFFRGGRGIASPSPRPSKLRS